MDNQEKHIQLNGKFGGISFALLMAFYLLISLVFQAIAGVIFEKNSAGYLAVCSLSSVTAICVTLCFAKNRTKTPVKQLVNLQTLGGVNNLLSLVLSAGMFLGLGLVNTVIAELLIKAGLNAGGISLPLNNVWQLVLFAITVAILPAVFEELFFRGLLLTCLSKTGSISSILLSSLCFAIYHGSLSQFLYQFIYGVALGFLAYNSKSVLPSIICHFINNFAVLLLTYLKVAVNLISPILLIIGINLLAFFGTACYFIFRKQEKLKKQKGEVYNFFLPFGIFGFILCLTLIIGNLFI